MLSGCRKFHIGSFISGSMLTGCSFNKQTGGRPENDQAVMPQGFYDGYDHEISEVYLYDIV